MQQRVRRQRGSDEGAETFPVYARRYICTREIAKLCRSRAAALAHSKKSYEKVKLFRMKRPSSVASEPCRLRRGET